jgi:hypothetical protein
VSLLGWQTLLHATPGAASRSVGERPLPSVRNLWTPLLVAEAAVVPLLLNPVWAVGAAPLSSLLQHFHLLLIFNFSEEREKMKKGGRGKEGGKRQEDSRAHLIKILEGFCKLEGGRHY